MLDVIISPLKRSRLGVQLLVNRKKTSQVHQSDCIFFDIICLKVETRQALDVVFSNLNAQYKKKTDKHQNSKNVIENATS